MNNLYVFANNNSINEWDKLGLVVTTSPFISITVAVKVLGSAKIGLCRRLLIECLGKVGSGDFHSVTVEATIFRKETASCWTCPDIKVECRNKEGDSYWIGQ